MYSFDGAFNGPPPCFTSGYTGSQGDRLVIPSTGIWLIGANLDGSLYDSPVPLAELRVNGVSVGSLSTGTDAHSLAMRNAGDVVQLYLSQGDTRYSTSLFLIGPFPNLDAITNAPTETFNTGSVTTPHNTFAFIVPTHASGSSLTSAFGSIGLNVAQNGLYLVSGTMTSNLTRNGCATCNAGMPIVAGRNVANSTTAGIQGTCTSTKPCLGKAQSSATGDTISIAFYSIVNMTAGGSTPADTIMFDAAAFTFPSPQTATRTVTVDGLTVTNLTGACGATPVATSDEPMIFITT
jgi:hypothetical protein